MKPGRENKKIDMIIPIVKSTIVQGACLSLTPYLNIKINPKPNSSTDSSRNRMIQFQSSFFYSHVLVLPQQDLDLNGKVKPIIRRPEKVKSKNKYWDPIVVEM